MRFAIYSRKSKFTGKGESIGNQIEMCQEYIKLHFGDVPSSDIFVFEDEGYSGKTLNRPQFKLLMEAESLNPFDYIVVYRLDRVSRNVGDFANLIEKLNGYNTSFICIKEQFDTSTPMGRAMMNIAAVFAQLERETIAERIKDNMYLLAKEGRWTGGTTPLGYKSEKHTITDGNKERSYHTLKIDEDQLDYVRLIFDKYIELRSLNGVECFLRENGYKTQNGKEWGKANIKRILTNPVYAVADKDTYEYFNKLGCNVCFTLDDCDGESGILPYNRFAGQKRKISTPDKWVITQSIHKGILSGADWIQIQESIAENSRRGFGGATVTRRTINPKSVFSGLLRCKCGAYMRPKIYPSGNMSYMCEKKAKTKKQECDMPNINGDFLDQEILKEIFAFDVSGSKINEQFIKLRSSIENKCEDLDNDILRQKRKIDENDQSITNLIMTLSKGVSKVVEEHISKQIESLTETNQRLNEEVLRLSNKKQVRADLEKSLVSMENTFAYLRDNFDSLSIANKRRYVKQIISKIVWDGDTIHIFIRGCF